MAADNDVTLEDIARLCDVSILAVQKSVRCLVRLS